MRKEDDHDLVQRFLKKGEGYPAPQPSFPTKLQYHTVTEKAGKGDPGVTYLSKVNNGNMTRMCETCK